MTFKSEGSAVRILRHARATLLCATALLVTGCTGTGLSTGKSTFTVQYEVSGTADKVLVHHTLSDGTASEPSTVTPPWTETVEVAPGMAVAILAQRVGETGNVRCRLTVNGQETGTNDYSDATHFARCTAALPPAR